MRERLPYPPFKCPLEVFPIMSENLPGTTGVHRTSLMPEGNASGRPRVLVVTSPYSCASAAAETPVLPIALEQLCPQQDSESSSHSGSTQP